MINKIGLVDTPSVGIDLKELGGGSAAEMFEILPRDWNLKPIFTQKWASVDRNWGVQPPSTPLPTIPTLDTPVLNGINGIQIASAATELYNISRPSDYFMTIFNLLLLTVKNLSTWSSW